MKPTWQEKLQKYTDYYNIPLAYLAEILYEPKVVPMIRGKAFEYTVLLKLQDVLAQNEWKVSKAVMTEESAFHDTDVKIIHKRSGKNIRIECKLADKESFRQVADGHAEIQVKCMRSRTLGSAKVKDLAPKLGVDEETLMTHNDQYLPVDFEAVVTSIGNAFYRTDKTSGLYVWKPNDVEVAFLELLTTESNQDLKEVAYHTIYVARTRDLAARPENGIVCTRRKCQNKTACGFIPNYPVIRLAGNPPKPIAPWIPIEKSGDLFKSFITS